MQMESALFFHILFLSDSNIIKQVSTITIANTSKKKGAHNERLVNQ